jgi:hypothetical protein
MPHINKENASLKEESMFLSRVLDNTGYATEEMAMEILRWTSRDIIANSVTNVNSITCGSLSEGIGRIESYLAASSRFMQTGPRRRLMSGIGHKSIVYLETDTVVSGCGSIIPIDT